MDVHERAACMLVCCCGLPGAGKTTLCGQLHSSMLACAASGARILSVSIYVQITYNICDNDQHRGSRKIILGHARNKTGRGRGPTHKL